MHELLKCQIYLEDYVSQEEEKSTAQTIFKGRQVNVIVHGQRCKSQIRPASLSSQSGPVMLCSSGKGSPHAKVAASRGDSGCERSSPPVDIGSHREQEELGQQMHANFPDDHISLGTLSANRYWIVICLSQPSHLWLHGLAYAALRLES